MRSVLIGTGYFNMSWKMLSGILALSLPLSAGLAYAAPGDVNSINTGQNIPAGTYFNTAGSRTTFINNGGGLWLHSGNLVRGLESSITKVPNGNGGTLYFRAPNNVVRLDGNIDVSAVRNGTLYTGNGGKVFVDSGYLFQNGNIFANGSNGGLVQLNVGGMTLGSNAKITAQGFGGDGGSVNINSPGSVDLRSGSIIDTSGKVTGTIDTNVINVEGSLVNNQGIIRANGAFGVDNKPDDGDAAVMAQHPQLANNPVPPPISAGNGTHDTATMSNILFQLPVNAAFRGGTVRLVAAGQNFSTRDIINAANSQLVTPSLKNEFNNRNQALVQSSNGNVMNQGQLVADGTLGKNGGTIILAAANNVSNTATIRALGGNAPAGIFDTNGNGANGGNGGTITVSAINNIRNTGMVQADGGQGASSKSADIRTSNGQDALAVVNGTPGAGGQGGLLAFSFGAGLGNAGKLEALGGVGGRGGNANSFDREFAVSTNPNPTARATSRAGRGGIGGQGGLILFSGNANPLGGGSVFANGGQGGGGGNANADAQAASNLGVAKAIADAKKGDGGHGGQAGMVVARSGGAFASSQNFSAKSGGLGNSGNASSRQVVDQNGLTIITTHSSPVDLGKVTEGGNRGVQNTRRNEYIRHEDVAVLFSQNTGSGANNNTLTGRLSNAQLRTVSTPQGTSSSTLDNAESASHFVIGGTTPKETLTANLVNANTNPLFFNLNTLTVVNNGNLINNMLWTPGVHLIGAGFHDMELALGGGHISWLAIGSIANNNIVITRGLWTGGSTQVAATQDVINRGDFINVAPFKELLSGFSVTGPKYESSHAGSLTLKGGHDVINASNGKLASNLIFFDIHPPLNQNPPIDWPKFLNGAQIGATLNLLAGRNLLNDGLIGADALTYRNGALGQQNPALTIGGILIGRSNLGTTTNHGILTASGSAFFSPNEADGARFNKNIFPATTSFPGTVDFK